ncbi:MAG: hypothetical protein C3F07_03170 [Anaerolineales bacterium]|nr:hypothetical protein [Anaerolineae bacterium]PWB76858.1 MAG: hypothetical protein C3F07_03170 [Anaerolineales bacterium]
MASETVYRSAFFILFILLLAMRVCFMVKVRRSGGHILSDVSQPKFVINVRGTGYRLVAD